MTYKVTLNYGEKVLEVKADNFTQDKAGVTFYRGKDADNVGLAIAFFPIEDISFITSVEEKIQ